MSQQFAIEVRSHHETDGHWMLLCGESGMPLVGSWQQLEEIVQSMSEHCHVRRIPKIRASEIKHA